MQINHKCDNPPCWRISHLELGTPSSNTQAMWDRRRYPGNDRWLPDEVVLEARQMADEGHSQAYIAECLNLNAKTVSFIVRGVHRVNVGGPITIIDRRGSSRFVGVNAYDGKWRATIRVEGKYHYLGFFGHEVDAARAYNNFIIANNLNRQLNVIDEDPQISNQLGNSEGNETSALSEVATQE
jgi:hypothetical protein